MKTILLIDDDDTCRAPAAEFLRRERWRVFEASDGESGIELALQHRPDVILCDLLMPRVNGYQVCRAVRGQLALRDTRILVLTGRDFPADRKSAEDAGADGYLVKPLQFSVLRAALEKVLPPASEQQREGQASPLLLSASETRLKFWGVRGSIPAPGDATKHVGGNTSCVELRIGGELIICDAGSGLRPLGLALVEEARGHPLNLTLLITHAHWDHIQGFPFFLPAYDPKNKLRILGYEGASEGLRSTLAGQMESPYFPLSLDEMPGNIVIEELREMQFQVGAITVDACFTNHPGICVGYRFHAPEGVIIYMPDNETISREESDGGGAVPSTMEANIAEFIRDADILIMDAQYDAHEYLRHVGWGHGCLDEVVALATSANVKRLFLFHHDPAHDDRTLLAMVAHARQLARAVGSPMQIEAAREGEEVVLGARARDLAIG
jgi:phosphoribosyl 1,2-cyclic phosphodiesterase/CheY-like chemotaxis protein